VTIAKAWHSRIWSCAGVQAIAAIVVVALSFVAGGRAAALSALGGAAVAWVTTLYASRRASVPEQSVGAALGRVVTGEFIKVLSTIALFAAASRVPHMVWPALLCGYVAALAAFWLWFVTGSGGQDTDRTRAP